MTLIEGIAGLIASVIAIVTAVVLAARYLGRKFERWINETVTNTKAMQTLTLRVFKLEQTIKKGNNP